MSNRLSKQDIINRVAEFDIFESKVQAREFLDDFFDLVIEITSAGDEFTYSPYLKFSKFTSSTTGKSKLKMTPFKAVQDAFVEA